MYNVIITEDYIIGSNNLGGQDEAKFESEEEVKSLIKSITVASGNPSIVNGIFYWYTGNRVLTASIYHNNKPVNGNNYSDGLM